MRGRECKSDISAVLESIHPEINITDSRGQRGLMAEGESEVVVQVEAEHLV